MTQYSDHVLRLGTHFACFFFVSLVAVEQYHIEFGIIIVGEFHTNSHRSSAAHEPKIPSLFRPEIGYVSVGRIMRPASLFQYVRPAGHAPHGKDQTSCMYYSHYRTPGTSGAADSKPNAVYMMEKSCARPERRELQKDKTKGGYPYPREHVRVYSMPKV
ncbi:uncharacterized protein B0I36DRAFT_138296 [Microdochium trichocladiopsis]|uniref:Uncharacterized protein n=1 Tax=Microdochium trichocladiopsis TaxID=1682393 RepID=A0A9P9BRM0_9PEZI|nr:uncharacterized protein B0I36DRAFT_138296 [Microdochium trichocladiopsis]KAH7027415.1 hypothetical protein B0I36DRAFT_138296 [Microdochium trichocladiopsis]